MDQGPLLQINVTHRTNCLEIHAVIHFLAIIICAIIVQTTTTQLWIPFYWNVYQSKTEFLLYVNGDGESIGEMGHWFVSVINQIDTGNNYDNLKKKVIHQIPMRIE